jgi:antibiotic biosynthesis monooxygenase (ABM) superfamily enzyme
MSVRLGGRQRTASPEPATAVFERRVKPRREADHEALAREMVEKSEKFVGRISSTMLHEEGSSTDALVYRFADGVTLRAWLETPERRRLVDQADRWSAEHERVPPLTGLETWFAR